mgnify:FL=1
MRKANLGFTIVELLLYIGLLSIFLTVLTGIFVSTLDIKLESEATSAVEQDGRFVLNRLMYDFGRADNITSPAALGQQTNSLVLVIGGTNFTYSSVGQDLVLTDGVGSGNLNSDNSSVTNLTFTRLGNSGGVPIVQIKYTITSEVIRPKGPEVRSFQTTLGLR